MQKQIKELVKGDIIKIQYGDFGNFIKVVFNKAIPLQDGWTEIEVCYVGDSKIFSIFDSKNESVEVC